MKEQMKNLDQTANHDLKTKRQIGRVKKPKRPG